MTELTELIAFVSHPDGSVSIDPRSDYYVGDYFDQWTPPWQPSPYPVPYVPYVPYVPPAPAAPPPPPTITTNVTTDPTWPLIAAINRLAKAVEELVSRYDAVSEDDEEERT